MVQALSENTKESQRKTQEAYSYLWNNTAPDSLGESWHFDKVQEVVIEEIGRGEKGLEVGCGFGKDTRILSGRYPDKEIFAVDISDGVYLAKILNQGSANAHIVMASAMALPFAEGSFDFCYSFGVLHHAPQPANCLKEIFRVLKPQAKVYLYLYDDHKDNPWKYYPLKAVSLLRRITLRMDKRVLYFFCSLASPLVFAFFSLPAKAFRNFAPWRGLSAGMPFNFAKSPFSLRGDLYDRFSAPLEYRFSRGGLFSLFAASGFSNLKVSHLKDTAGWVAWAQK